MGWGPIDDGQALIGLERAYGPEARLFDTADVYGHGRSERLLGRLVGQVSRYAEFGENDQWLDEALETTGQFRAEGLGQAIGMRGPHRFILVRLNGSRACTDKVARIQTLLERRPRPPHHGHRGSQATLRPASPPREGDRSRPDEPRPPPRGPTPGHPADPRRSAHPHQHHHPLPPARLPRRRALRHRITRASGLHAATHLACGRGRSLTPFDARGTPARARAGPVLHGRRPRRIHGPAAPLRLRRARGNAVSSPT